jgi:O-acetyl-ADP-ribose deacetylase (regulator of RNase III)
MSTIKHVKGDLTDPSTYIPNYDSEKNPLFICHQTNPFGIMGAGVALALAKKYPEILEQYVEYCSNPMQNILGTALFTPTGILYIYVINLFGQKTMNQERDTDYEHIYAALEEFFSFLPDYPEYSIAFPKNMSSALAGGKWNIIYSMIESLSKDLPNDVYIVEYVEA